MLRESCAISRTGGNESPVGAAEAHADLAAHFFVRAIEVDRAEPV